MATGFLAVGPKGLNEKNKEIFRMEVVDDQIDTTSRAVLGLTVACARCHDHKFDPIPTKDYYALAGIFRSTNTYFGTGGAAAKQNKNGTALVALGPPPARRDTGRARGSLRLSQPRAAGVPAAIAGDPKRRGASRSSHRRSARN